MIQGSSRRSFLKFIPGGLLALLTARFVSTAGAQQQPPGTSKTPTFHGGGGMNHDILNGSNGSANGNGPGSQNGGTGQPQSGDGTVPPPPKKDGTDSKTNPLTVPRRSLTDAQKNMRLNVEQLAKMAEELKQDVEKTDSTKVLSLEMVRKSQEIEKLAHQIAALAKG